MSLFSTPADANPCTAVASVTVVDTVSYDFQSGYVVSSDTTWANVHFRINGGIYIAPGVTFTLVNSTLEFSENGYSGEPGEWGIFVDTGARLNVIHDTLTSIRSCGTTMWDGIFVKGSYWVMPAPENGLAVISGNSVVEHAHVGIQSGYSMDAKDAYAGGNIQVVSSKFLNNRRHVVIRNHFKHVNTCTFEKAEFLCTAPLLDSQKYNGEGTLHYMELARTEKMPVRGCTFKNTVLFSGIIGTGIKSWDGSFIADRTCDVVNNTTCECEGQRNRFEGLLIGIDAANFSVSKSVEVDGCEFVNNLNGVRLYGSHSPVILRNTFTNQLHGLFMLECTGYQVEENSFTTGQTFSYGIGINNMWTNNNYNRIYNNTFTNQTAGTVVMGQNRGNDKSVGLKVKCNIYNANEYDMAATVAPGFSSRQGFKFDIKSPAGNIFDSCSVADGEIKIGSGALGIVYTHHDTIITTPRTGCYDSSKVTAINSLDGFTRTTACPATDFSLPDCGGGGYAGIRAIIADNESLATTAQINYSALLDGGDTQAMLDVIETESTGNAKNELMTASPYLSDTVLVTYAKTPTKGKNGVPPGHIKEVMIANSPVTKRVKTVVDARKLPPGIQSQIDAAQVGISPRGELEDEINYYLSEKELAVNGLVSAFLHDDTLIDRLDSIVAILENEPGKDAKTALASVYLENQDTAKAQTLIDSLRSLPELDNFCDLQQLLIDEGVNLYADIVNDSITRSMVEQIADDTLKQGSMQARILLGIIFDRPIPEYILLPSQVQSKTNGSGNNEETGGKEITLSEEKPDETIYEGYRLSNYPNPFSDGTIIATYIPQEYGNPEIVVYDMVGNVITKFKLKQGQNFNEIGSDRLKHGIYFYTLISDGVKIETKKMVRLK